MEPTPKADPEPKAEPADKPEPAKAITRTVVSKTPVPRAADNQLASRVKQIFRSRCAECHGAERKEADLNVLDWASFVGEDGSVVPEDADESYLFVSAD